MKVYLLPFAGGSSYFYIKWTHSEIEFIPLEYSGHGSRMKEPLYHCIEENAKDILNQIKTTLKNDEYAIYGHSLGSFVTYELYKNILALNMKQPKHIFLSGSRAPHMKVRKQLTQLDFEDYKNEVISLGGVTEDYFTNKAIYDIFNPILKNDFYLDETYMVGEQVKFECGVSILNGKQDELVNTYERLAWREYCIKGCEFVMYEGGHFYLSDLYKEIISFIVNTLKNYGQD